jgi:hypothetical protein
MKKNVYKNGVRSLGDILQNGYCARAVTVHHKMYFVILKFLSDQLFNFLYK